MEASHTQFWSVAMATSIISKILLALVENKWKPVTLSSGLWPWLHQSDITSYVGRKNDIKWKPVTLDVCHTKFNLIVKCNLIW